MSNEIQSSNLPEGWVWTTIDELGIVVSGGTPSTKNKEFWGSEISWITPADLSNYDKKYIAKGAIDITKIGLEHSSAKLLNPLKYAHLKEFIDCFSSYDISKRQET